MVTSTVLWHKVAILEVNLLTAQECCWSPSNKQRTTVSVSTRSSLAGIIRIDMQTISKLSPVFKPQMETLVGLNSRKDLSDEVGDIYGDENMRESIRKLIRVGTAHI